MILILSTPQDYDIIHRGTYEECIAVLNREADRYSDLIKTIDSNIEDGKTVGHYDLSFYTNEDVYLFSLVICNKAVGDTVDPPPAEVIMKAELICSALANRN
jgi:hypothetical protein